MSSASADEWILLTSSSNAITIQIAQGKLESEGILAVIHNKQDSNYGFGSVELHVRRDDYLRAKNLLDA